MIYFSRLDMELVLFKNAVIDFEFGYRKNGNIDRRARHAYHIGNNILHLLQG